MENKKMTKKDYFDRILAIVEASAIEESEKEMYRTFVNHEKELLSRKASRSSETKTQKENVAIMEKIVSALNEIGKPVTISELQESNEEMREYSNQKLSALLKKLVEDNKVNKVSEKKKSYFSVAE